MKGLFLSVLMLAYVGAYSQSNQYLFVFLNKNVKAEQLSKEESSKIMEGHMANINKLAAQKKLLAAGPFEGGGGIFVLNTSSVDSAQHWLKNDPGVQAKRWIIEYLPYQPKIGSICTVSEPYEMVMYNFVRYTALVTKFNASTYPKLIAQHFAYVENLKRESIVTYGSFDEDGAILVVKDSVSDAWLSADPAVQEGLMEYQTKKLYIAKGSFCEK